MTDINRYQAEAISLAVYPERGAKSIPAITYCVLGLAGESGEVAEKVKKILRDCSGEMTSELAERVARELGDVLWYVAALADELGYSLSQIASINMTKLIDRRARGTLHGSGDDR